MKEQGYENYNTIYYRKHREKLLKKAKEHYHNTKKKTAVCRLCGAKMQGVHGSIKYCETCLNSKGHGVDAHRMAAVRWFRKKHLTKSNKSDTI